MRKSKLLPFIALYAAALASLAACGGDAQTAPSEGPSPAASPTPAVPPEPQPPMWTEQVFERALAADDGTEVMTVRYRLPAIENTYSLPAREAINDWYADEGASLLENIGGEEEWALSDYETAAGTGLEFQPYVDSQDFAIMRESEKRVSVLRTHYMHTGGASPTTFYFTDCFSLETGGRLSLAHCFTADEETAHARVLEEVLRLNQAGAYGGQVFDEKLVKAGFDPTLFYFNDEGLVIPFQAYALGVRSPLLPDRAIAYEALEDILAAW